MDRTPRCSAEADISYLGLRGTVDQELKLSKLRILYLVGLDSKNSVFVRCRRPDALA